MSAVTKKKSHACKGIVFILEDCFSAAPGMILFDCGDRILFCLRRLDYFRDVGDTGSTMGQQVRQTHYDGKQH